MKQYRNSRERHIAACARQRKPQWPEGATAGILMVAAACIGASATLYHIAGPSDVFAEDVIVR